MSSHPNINKAAMLYSVSLRRNILSAVAGGHSHNRRMPSWEDVRSVRGMCIVQSAVGGKPTTPIAHILDLRRIICIHTGKWYAMSMHFP